MAVGIGFMVFPRTWTLLRECINFLLEGVPSGMSLQAVRETIAGTAGVAAIHDVHLWAVTQSKPMLTGHVVLLPGADGEQVRRDIEDRLQAGFDLHHTTLQMESEDRSAAEHIH